MVDLQASVATAMAILVILLVPGLVWATVIAGLYTMIREQVAKLRAATRGELTPAEERVTK